MTTAIKIENISKQYRLGQIGTGTISHDLNRWWASVRGKEDPYAQVGQVNDRTTEATSDYVWALKDINFEVKQGEILGIIGRNGAGKSTLLKLLSRVTAPTTGTIKTRGRIASLLEVGTGMHPEMTGRENIYMNGAILGMRRNEITKQLDAIVEFSGCAKYLDTPVKRYSSGMMVRLGFAVAAHLQCEILIVDEVLAVGDAEFQKKAIGKMQEISHGGGRTVLFVSHNMQSIVTLTKKTVILVNGNVRFIGKTVDAIGSYLEQFEKKEKIAYPKPTSTPAYVSKVEIHTSEPAQMHTFGKPLRIEFEINCKSPVTNASLSFQILDYQMRPIVHLWRFDSEEPYCRTPGKYKLVCIINNPKLYMGRYSITVHFGEGPGGDKYQTLSGLCGFEIDMYGMHREFPWIKDTCTYLENCNWECYDAI